MRDSCFRSFPSPGSSRFFVFAFSARLACITVGNRYQERASEREREQEGDGFHRCRYAPLYSPLAGPKGLDFFRDKCRMQISCLLAPLRADLVHCSARHVPRDFERRYPRRPHESTLRRAPAGCSKIPGQSGHRDFRCSRPPPLPRCSSYRRSTLISLPCAVKLFQGESILRVRNGLQLHE